MKSRGPRIDPCRTLYFNSLLSDCVLLILMNCILSLRNEQNQLLATPLIPVVQLLKEYIMLYSIKKAFCKSRHTPQAYLPKSQPCLIFSVISNSACVVEWLCPKPKCLLYIILCLFKNIVRGACISFSIILLIYITEWWNWAIIIWKRYGLLS